MSVGELARRSMQLDPTARARLQRLGVLPDAELVSGARTIPLFLESRLAELSGLLASPVRPDVTTMH